MHVSVEPPEIRGDTVTFRWSQSRENAFQFQNSFYYRFEGLDLAHFSSELFYEMFLALQLRVFAGYGERVDLQFPSAVPRLTVDFWRAYHGAEQVDVSPISPSHSYSPWSGEPLYSDVKKSAVFFGGGKDSMLSASLLAEIYGPEQVLLIQFVGPLKPDPDHALFLEERQERLMLATTRAALGVSSHRGWTNYQANFRTDGYRLRPHYELYTVGALPILLTHDVRLASISMGWLPFTAMQSKNGSMHFRYRHSRPEALEAQTAHYRAAMGADLDIVNLGLPFNSLNAYWLLAERYPRSLASITMCTLGEHGKRWCYRCGKCTLFALLSLSISIVEHDFDYNHFFTKSGFIRRVLAYADSGVELNDLGLAPWQPFFSPPRSYVTYSHLVARIELHELRLTLSGDAIANLAVLQALFGNRLFPEIEAVPKVPLSRLVPELGSAVTEIVAEHMDILDSVPGPWFSGNRPTAYDFAANAPLPVLELAHIRAKMGVR